MGQRDGGDMIALFHFMLLPVYFYFYTTLLSCYSLLPVKLFYNEAKFFLLPRLN